MKRLTLVCLIVVASLWMGCAKAVDEYATVMFFIGDVKINDAATEIGAMIKENDRLVTAGRSSCDLKIGDSIIRIKENSKVLISQLMRKGAVENTALGLEVGRMLCKPKKLMKKESFLVKTPTAVAGVRGTKFTVEADIMKTTRIKVYEGSVKVIKRVEKLEGSIEKIMEGAPAVEEKEKVVVTENDVKKATKRVDEILARESGEGFEVAVVKVIEEAGGDVVVSRKEVQAFKVEDFKDEKSELIAVEERPREVIRQIAAVVKMEKEKPKPDGRLLITRYEIYFIKNGSVLWEGKVINPPVRRDDRIYIASGDYVYCASADGPVLWRKNLNNDGRLEIRGDRLIVHARGGQKSLDLDTGQE
ncbi:MAG TPA: FecR domain-containing protein [Spirochaetota bacterium]|nr:FecR domain-containing protein [Spirochaetota bacterium]